MSDYLITARTWLYENTNDADPEFERRAESLAALLRKQREEIVEACAKHVENHSCVASCCDAQPSGGEAKSLADCVRRAATTHPLPRSK